MAWTVTFKQDTERKGVGTLAATDGTVRVERRVDTGKVAEVRTFVAEAKAAAAQVIADAHAVAAVEAAVADELNKAG